MMRALMLISCVVAVGIVTFVAFQTEEATAQTALQPPETDVIVGETLYGKNCAACHGANLEGQPDWRSSGDDGKLRAPPHDISGHTWHHGDSLIFRYTKLGGKEAMAQQGMDFDSGMPGFRDVLSDAEIWNIIGYIKSTWPKRMQDMQAERTKSEQIQGDLK
jgi:mono/diheme cytochrome c family protein